MPRCDNCRQPAVWSNLNPRKPVALGDCVVYLCAKHRDAALLEVARYFAFLGIRAPMDPGYDLTEAS